MQKTENGLQSARLEKKVRAYLQSKSAELKKEVVCLSEKLINYYASLYSPGTIDEDLRQAGYEGLLKALKKFDPERGVLFSTYASHCIIGEIRHELRSRAVFKVPDWLRSLQAKIISVTEELAQKNGTMPTLKEIAASINVAEEGIVEAMQAGCVSMEDIDWSKVRRLRYENFKLPIEDVITINMSLEKMDDMQRVIIKMIYFEGLTQEQVAMKLGLNQRKVSRILHRALSDMRAYVL